MEGTPGRGYRVYKALEQEHGVCRNLQTCQAQGGLKSLAGGMGKLLGSVPEGGMGTEEDLGCLGSGGAGKMVKPLVLPVLKGGPLLSSCFPPTPAL